jgi:hypothetical protein
VRGEPQAQAVSAGRLVSRERQAGRAHWHAARFRATRIP